MRRSFLALIALSGCLPARQPERLVVTAAAPSWAVGAPPEAMAALALVWQDYGSAGPMPTTYFRAPEANCDGGFMDGDGTCLSGATFEPANVVVVSTDPYWTCETIAHEYCHAREWFGAADIDAGHLHEPCFAIGEHPELGTAEPENGTLVLAETRKLQATGLCPSH